jgi:hypothetical protein
VARLLSNGEFARLCTGLVAGHDNRQRADQNSGN